MRTLRPVKRSVSPFAIPEELKPVHLENPFDDAVAALEVAVSPSGAPAPEKKPKLPKTPDELAVLPAFLRKVGDAPAGDAPDLESLCRFLLQYQETFREKKWDGLLHTVMQGLFDRKTELFMVDHYDREHCEKMGWADDHRDVILFAKERDILVGHYFAPMAESQPGKFSEFVGHWAGTDNADRVLHFLDFCAGSKNPTFEHYLLFTHPSLGRVVRGKDQLKSLFEKAQPLLKKITSPTWEKTVRTALGV